MPTRYGDAPITPSISRSALGSCTFMILLLGGGCSSPPSDPGTSTPGGETESTPTQPATESPGEATPSSVKASPTPTLGQHTATNIINHPQTNSPTLGHGTTATPQGTHASSVTPGQKTYAPTKVQPTPTATPINSTPLNTLVPATPTLSDSQRCAEQEPELLAMPLRRLSRQQYSNSLTHLVYALTSEPDAAEWYASNIEGSVLYGLPEDTLTGAPEDNRGGFKRLDQTIYQEHVEAWMTASVYMATNILTEWALDQLVPDCSIRWDTENCLEPTFRTLGHMIHRRPLTEEDLAFYVEVFDEALAAQTAAADEETSDSLIFRAALKDAMTVMMSSPYSTYHIEHGSGIGIDGQEDADFVDAYELANRLSFHFWQGPPDAELHALAADDSLLNEEVYEAQVQRLFADPRAQKSLESFYKEWLRLDELPEMNSLNGTKTWQAFVGDGFEPDQNLNDEMIEEVTDLALYHTLSEPSTFEQFFLSNRHVSQSENLSYIYNMAPWDGSNPPENFVEDQRDGLLTRAAFLATGSTETRPIMKGIWVYEALLCQQLGDPPDNAAASPPISSSDLTTREVVEILTEDPNTNCSACHVYSINPYGFATENFDALGRHRLTQRLFDDNGQQVNEKPVNTADTAYLDWVPQDFENSTELNNLMLQTDHLQTCFAQHYFRYTFSRPEDDSIDHCTIQDLSSQLSQGQTLDNVLLSIALRPEFKRHSFADVDGGE